MSNPAKNQHASPSGAILPENHHFPRHEGQEDYSPGNSSDREGCQLQVVTPITKGGSSSSDPTEDVSSTDTPSGTSSTCTLDPKGVDQTDTPPTVAHFADTLKGATSTCTPDPKGVHQADTLPVDDIDTKGPPFWGTLQPTTGRDG